VTDKSLSVVLGNNRCQSSAFESGIFGISREFILGQSSCTVFVVEQ